MNKGIVMEMSDRHIIVMTPEGDFRKLPQDGRSCEVGEEILFATPVHARKVPPMAKLSGLVAAVVMCIALVTAMTNMSGKADIVAYVSMDINPSVEFGIDAAEKVQDLKGLNDDGTKLINGIDFKGKELNAVAEAVLTKADQGPLAAGDGDIVIASSLVKSTDKISDAAIADKLKEQVTKHIEAAYPQQAANYDVTAFAAPQEVRTAAEAHGLSTGKYAIYLAAKNSGTDVPLEDFKTESIHQLAKDNDGIAAVVKAQQPPAKSVFKQLLEDEKSGKLDERAKQLAEKKSTSANDKSGESDDKSNTSKSNSKSGNKKNSNGKTDEKTTGKSTSKNDTKNGDLTGSILKPAVSTSKSTVEDHSSSQGKNSGQESDKNKSDSKISSKANGKNKNQQDDKANPPRKAEDSKAGVKPADSGNNDTSAKNDDKKNDNKSEKNNQDNKDNQDSKDNNDNNDNNDNKDNGKNNNGKDNSNGKSNNGKSNNSKDSNSKDNGSDKYDND